MIGGMKYHMSTKELKRLFVLEQSVEGKLTVKEAAELLHLTERRIKQLKKEFREKGVTVAIHGNANKPSPKRTDKTTEERILGIRKKEPYCSSNFNHFREILKEHFDIRISYSALYRLLTEHGIKSPKKRRKKRRVYKTRERRPAFGMMLQADASPFNWFGGEKKFSLHGFIDDATGKLTGLYLCENECLLGYLEVLRQTLISFGIPQSLYPDRHSVFFYTPQDKDKLSIEEQLSGCTKKVTQFGKIVEQLGIDMFPAQSPQAKGRIERSWNTLQSRLPVELKMRGITSMEKANLFFEKEYINLFNEQFSVEPKESYSAFVPIPHTIDLDRLLSVKLERSLSSGSTISICNKLFKIEQDRFSAREKVTVLLSKKHGLRALISGEFYPIYPIDEISYAEDVVRTGDFPTVVVSLLHHFFLSDVRLGHFPEGVKYSQNN